MEALPDNLDAVSDSEQASILKQELADARLELEFRAAAGVVEDVTNVTQGTGCTTTLPDAFNYVAHTVSLQESQGAACSKVELEAYGERVLRPGLVQVHGLCMLLSKGLSKSEGEILAVSRNSAGFVGREPEDLLGVSLLDASSGILTPASIATLREAFSATDITVYNPLSVSTATPSNFPRHFTLILHETEEGVVVDFEVGIADESGLGGGGALKAHQLARKSVRRLQMLTPSSVTAERNLCLCMCEELQALTGYDRIMCYMFHEDLHGEVVAEVHAPGMDPMLGLHFPSTDIPQAARSLFVVNRSRMIVNTCQAPTTMLQQDALKRSVLMGKSQLRGVAGCHAQYMANMGSIASLVFAVVIRTCGSKGTSDPLAPASEKLWGLCVCHHREPRYVPYAIRSAAEFLTQVFSLQLASAVEASKRQRGERVTNLQAVLCDVLTRSHGSFEDILGALTVPRPGLLELCGATGAAVIYGTHLNRMGLLPEDMFIRSLVAWAALQPEMRVEAPGLLAVSNLNAAGYPQAKEVTRVAAAAMIMRVQRPGDEPAAPGAVPGSGGPVWVIWFRQEAKNEIRWAGDTNLPGGTAAGTQEASGLMGMTPRASFAAFVQMRDMCPAHPWDDHDLQAAKGLQLLVADALRYGEESALTTSILVRLNQDRLRSVESLQGLATELSNMVQTANLPVVTLSCAGEVMEWNLRTAELSGLSREAVVNRPLADFLTERTADALRTAIAVAMSEEEQVHAEISFPSRDGKPESTLDMNISRRRSAVGKVVGLVLVGVDATEHRRLMQECSRMANDYSLIVSHSASPVFGTDMDGRVNEWNRAASRLMGLEAPDVMGAYLVGEVLGTNGRLRLANVEQQVLLEIALQNALRNQSNAEPVALTFNLRDGRSVDLLVNAETRRNSEGNATGVFCFAQDTGLRNALEKATTVRMAAEAAAEAKTRQLATLCHEIRNPLNGIMGNVFALDELEVANPEQRDIISATITCVHQLRRTVDDMLDFSKIEEGKLSVEFAPFSVRSLVNAVVSQVQRAAEEKGLQVLSDIRCADWYNGDGCRIQQVMANFVWNAIKFTESGNVTIRVESVLDALDSKKHQLFFKCIDTGCGIDSEVQARLFQPYEMANPSRITKYGGSGLGLNICRALANLLGGRVHCISAPGAGSTFVLELVLEHLPNHSGDRPPNVRISTTSTNAAWPMRLSEDTPVNPRQSSNGLARPAPRVSWTVARETITDAEVAVLLSVDAPGHSGHVWGSSTRKPGTRLAEALQAAMDDALSRSGVPLPVTAAAAPLAAVSPPVAPASVSHPFPTVSSLGAQGVAGVPQWAPPAAGGTWFVSQGSQGSYRRESSNGGVPFQTAPQQDVNAGDPLKTVLCVDDEPVNRKLIERWLKKEGVDVTTGEDGQDVVDLMISQGRRFDVVLLDEHMRRMNGSAAVLRLRKHEHQKGLPSTPVLVTTGNAMSTDQQLYMASGFDGFLCKPLDLKSLSSNMRAYLKARVENGAGAAGALWFATGLGPDGVDMTMTRADNALPQQGGAIVVFNPPPPMLAAAAVAAAGSSRDKKRARGQI